VGAAWASAGVEKALVWGGVISKVGWLSLLGAPPRSFFLYSAAKLRCVGGSDQLNFNTQDLLFKQKAKQMNYSSQFTSFEKEMEEGTAELHAHFCLQFESNSQCASKYSS
jgi:hypothetical protein